MMKRFTYLNSPELPPEPWRLPALAPPTAADSLPKKSPTIYWGNATGLGTQVMPYAVVINARKSPRDYYED